MNILTIPIQHFWTRLVGFWNVSIWTWGFSNVCFLTMNLSSIFSFECAPIHWNETVHHTLADVMKCKVWFLLLICKCKIISNSKTIAEPVTGWLTAMATRGPGAGGSSVSTGIWNLRSGCHSYVPLVLCKNPFVLCHSNTSRCYMVYGAVTGLLVCKTEVVVWS